VTYAEYTHAETHKRVYRAILRIARYSHGKSSVRL